MKKVILIILCFWLFLALLGYLLIKLKLPNATITSWFRTMKHNQEVGGVWNSSHLLGLGYDIVPIPSQEEQSKFWFFRAKLNEGSHLHLGWYG